MAVVGEEAAAGREDGTGAVGLLDAVPWFLLVAAIVVGGLLFAAFGLLFGARVLHRLLP